MRIVVTRGPVAESEHRVHGVIADVNGPRAVWGDRTRAVIPRSAIKFIQAVPLVRTGAAKRFNVTDIELALACSSHSGEAAHVDAVRAWLARIGLDESALECGPDDPIAGPGDRVGLSPEPIYNCCSGKHTGFLTVARHLGMDHRGYIEPDHPVQKLVTEAIEDVTGVDLSNQTPGRDGCAIPTFAIPLIDLATAMARLTGPERLSPELRASGTDEAARRLIEAPNGRQFWISGTGRHEVFLGDAVAEPLMVKAGAEGVFMAALPERGIGLACKAEDGGQRAAQAGISAMLAWVGALAEDRVAAAVHNKSDDLVGHILVPDFNPDWEPSAGTTSNPG
ncbi:MAG: asparaginase [Actinomycetota bacterium]